MNNLIIKLNRFSAWLLILLIIIYFLTGFDALKNFWRADFSRYLHDKILPLPALILIFFHLTVGVKLYLLRHELESRALNIIFLLTIIVLFSLLFYLFLR